MIPIIDSYKNLTEKTKYGIKWAHQMKNSSHILKIDDDSIARVSDLSNWLLAFAQDYKFFYLGNQAARPVTTDGKWADREFLNATGLKLYPKYANGASGYTISRAIAEVLVENFDDLESFANEDASLGYWIEKYIGHRKVHYTDVRNRLFTTSGYNECSNARHLVVGHKLTPVGLRRCWNHMMIAIAKYQNSELIEDEKKRLENYRMNGGNYI